MGSLNAQREKKYIFILISIPLRFERNILYFMRQLFAILSGVGQVRVFFYKKHTVVVLIDVSPGENIKITVSVMSWTL